MLSPLAPNPLCLHTTSASLWSHPLSHTVPQKPSTQISTLRFTLPLSTHKTKISRAALRLGGAVSLTDNTDNWGRTIAGWWWWFYACWTLLQWTLISSAPHISAEYGSIATAKEWSSQRNSPCIVNLHHKLWFNHAAHREIPVHWQTYTAIMCFL